MTSDEIAAERERCFDGQKQPENEYNDGVWDGWKARAEIARAEQAELRAENERLRERVRELAKGKLQRIISDDADAMFPRGSRGWWAIACGNQSDAWLMQLAEEAGVWFDDNGNEVPLAEWRARQGGVG